jgi:hypothetical protein
MLIPINNEARGLRLKVRGARRQSNALIYWAVFFIAVAEVARFCAG